jgi:hypothetical protein
MANTTIYRVQDREGRGPWRPGFSHKWVESRPDHENLPPWYVEFGNIHFTADPRDYTGSGCRTIEQLRRWFTLSEYVTLEAYGYQPVVLDHVNVLAESDVQVFFTRRIPLNFRVYPVRLY